jgi:hypothetical protein
MLKFRKLSVAAALAAACIFAACEQAPLDTRPVEPAAYSAARAVGIPPTQWTAFSPLPFSGMSNITSVSGLAANNSYLVAAGFDNNSGIPYAMRYYPSEGWDYLSNLRAFGLTIKPGAAHYLNNTYYLITGASTSSTGVYCSDGVNWQPTGNIGFGTKAATFGGGYYVLAGQNGQAAYSPGLNYNFGTVPSSVTGWSGTGNAAYINAAVYTAEGLYVFGGGSGRIAYTSNITSSTPWATATGTIIDPSNYPFTSDDFVNALAYNGVATVVAGGNTPGGTGILAYSFDYGQTWQEAYTGFSDILSDGIFSVTYGTYTDGRGYFVAANDNGVLAYSYDGTSWLDGVSGVFGPGARVDAAVFYRTTNSFLAAGGDSSGVQIAISN